MDLIFLQDRVEVLEKKVRDMEILLQKYEARLKEAENKAARANDYTIGQALSIYDR